ncbi:MAG: hypothetical protein JWM34_3251 [Ilumatobacteraceae bacterium]|nr:hypothetical protein [Ilumatobacteraceae bacterium]
MRGPCLLRRIASSISVEAIAARLDALTYNGIQSVLSEASVLRSMHLRTDPNGLAELVPMSLPVMDIGALNALKSSGVRFRSLRALRREHGRPGAGPGTSRKFAVMISGSLHVAAASSECTLSPGGILFVDDHDSAGHALTYFGEARLLQVEVNEDWHATGRTPEVHGDDPGGAGRSTQQFRLTADDRLVAVGPESFEELIPPSWSSLGPRGAFIVLAGDGGRARWTSDGGAVVVVVLGGHLVVSVLGSLGGDAPPALLAAGDLVALGDQPFELELSASSTPATFGAFMS